jgi:hypothetical protein
MSRLTIGLVALAGILAGALGYSVLNQPVPQTDTAAVQGMIDEAFSRYEARQAETAPVEVAGIDPAELNPLIESYLQRSRPGGAGQSRWRCDAGGILRL